MTLRPLFDRVLIKRADPEETTQSGLFIPPDGQEKPQEATVIAVGPEAKHVKVGESVLFGKYAGTEVLVDGVDHILLPEKDILGVVE